MRFQGMAMVVALGLGGVGAYAQGSEQLRSRNYAAAEREARAAIDREPENEEALRVLAMSLVRQSKSAEALRVLEKAQQKGNVGPDTQLALAAAYASEKRYDDAQKSVEAVEQQRADHPDLPYYRGMLAVLKKQYRESLPDLEKAIDSDRENAYAYYYAGLAYSNLKRPDKMMDSFNNFLRLEPNAPESAKVRSFMRAR